MVIIKKNIEVIEGDWIKTFRVKKAVENLVLPHDTSGIFIAVQDRVYDGIPFNINQDDVVIQHRTYGFVVDDWIKTKEISNQLNSIFNADAREDNFHFQAFDFKFVRGKTNEWIITYGKCFSWNRLLHICR